MKLLLLLVLMAGIIPEVQGQQRKRARDYGVKIGVLPTGKYNAITDVPGVKVGHTTLIQGSNIRTGVTAILPHGGNIFQDKVPAAIYVGNGFGKLAGSTQVQELGNLETPIILTNTLSVGTAMNAVINYTLNQKGNQEVRSVNAVVGETNDGYLNDIRGRHVTENHVLESIKQAKTGEVTEGNVGAGTGTVCYGFKGGIGTASRKLPASVGGYTVGVLVQTNFGGVLQIDGVPVGEELEHYFMMQQIKDSADGSCMIVVATDAPLDARNLERLAKRALLGMGKTGGIAANGSGDYVIAFSTEPTIRVPYNSESSTQTATYLINDVMSPLFLATIEATEEAIINSLFAAETMNGTENHKTEALPIDKVVKILKKHNATKR
ncbi:DmpA family aminopeptidase [Pontibacter fetidus]|uniref:P1 family peptidase n=1 Tax=Pontibacter fetidus TaxID=2700082 RepID=A0A6B2H9Z8_9BACT|nr:P1 family peptidase [Pontibacter fetidus]NDK56194.1 P1 family peptidase [Pontibacter fetidus]